MRSGKEGLEQKSFGAPPYKPLPPGMLYLTSDEWEDALARNKVRLFTPFPQPDMRGVVQIDFRGKHGRSFAIERAEYLEKLMPALAEHIKTLRSLGKRTIIACWTNVVRERLGNMIAAQGPRSHREGREYRGSAQDRQSGLELRFAWA